MIGILLALHGSKDPEWSEISKGYKEMLSKRFPLVEVGYLEYNSPSLREALEILVEKGADQVVVLPLFISLGRHIKEDFPRALGLTGDKAVVKGRSVKVVIAKPIGVDEKVAEVLAQRAEEALRG